MPDPTPDPAAIGNAILTAYADGATSIGIYLVHDAVTDELGRYGVDIHTFEPWKDRTGQVRHRIVAHGHAYNDDPAAAIAAAHTRYLGTKASA